MKNLEVELIKSLLATLHSGDQAARSSDRKLSQYDRFSTRILKAIIAFQGWPSISKYGKSAAHSAWLIAQHSPSLKFQETCLDTIRRLALDNEADPQDAAYLEDRILVRTGHPQIYGTQFTTDRRGRLVGYPISDRRKMVKRRAALGLDLYKNYERKLKAQQRRLSEIKIPIAMNEEHQSFKSKSIRARRSG